MATLDILFLTHNRVEFTEASMRALIDNTAWAKIRRFIWYDDNSTDETARVMEYLLSRIPISVPLKWCHGLFGSPVAVMADYLGQDPADYFAKIDNDTLVPFGWLTECLNVMERHPELDLLGIEVFDPIVAGKCKRSYRAAPHIGGIGLMRSRPFKLYGRPKPRGQRYGFTEWQHDLGAVVKGWLTPALPVVLLDKVPFEPWKQLTESYIAQGIARKWEPYNSRDFIWPYISEGIKKYEPATLRKTTDA